MENGEALIGTLILPEEVIQHIQSYMSGKEAARSTLLSKSWYTAWLTRPTIDLDDRDFGNPSTNYRKFESFARKTMQRYHDSSLNIKYFRLISRLRYYIGEEFSNELIVNAMKLGSTYVEIGNQPSYLQQEVLGSESLVSLSLIQGEIVGNCVISFSSLKSLNLKYVMVNNDTFDDMISCCDSLEELSLTNCRCIQLKLFGLHKLKRLLLDYMVVDCMFFADFASRFPCLKDLTIHNMGDWNRVHIAHSSLETISFKPFRSAKVTFDVPNIRKFSYSSSGLPSFSVNGALREWEFDLTIYCGRLYTTNWFLNLKRLMKKYRLSRIVSLYINVDDAQRLSFKHELGTEVVTEPLVVENLRIDAPTSIFSALLLRLFGISRPKFITKYWLSEGCDGWRCRNECLDILCKELMKEIITPNCGIPDQYVVGQFGLKKVNMEVYKEFDTEWQRPLPLEKPLNASKAPVEKRKAEYNRTATGNRSYSKHRVSCRFGSVRSTKLFGFVSTDGL